MVERSVLAAPPGTTEPRSDGVRRSGMNLRLLALAPLLLALTACGGDDTVARDPGSTDPGTSGADAPAVRPTRERPSNHSARSSSALSIM